MKASEYPALFATVWLDFPMAPAYDYRVPAGCDELTPGDWVLVPWGRQHRIGIVQALTDTPAIAEDRVRDITALLAEPPRMPAQWLTLGAFAAGYYHRQPGEIMLPAIPRSLRTPPGKTRLKASVYARARQRWEKHLQMSPVHAPAHQPAHAPVLTATQREVLDALPSADAGFAVHLLHGITGSGKTEVYLNWIARRLERDAHSQVLLLVPEIALTPQLAATVAGRLQLPMAVLHSGLAEGERARNWLAAADGRARLVVGTRLSVLTPMPRLAGIVVDEEHDASFKQAEGAHYSARDLAIVVARTADIPIVLGSATPALETWHRADTGRFQRHSLPERANGAPLPQITIASLRESTRAVHQPMVADGPVQGFAAESVAAIRANLAAGNQTLVFINRRGYAPVLNCRHCGWLSHCEHCAAWRVLHRLPGHKGSPWRLICHHCGVDSTVPRHCPACGDVDLQPVGQGTQRVEEVLAAAFGQARIGRLDRDIARRRGATDRLLESIHEGALDIIVGTQMLTKGHDFRKLELVVVLDADGGLFASDFRAPERLFGMLMQVAGRAGRHASGAGARVIVQTRFPDHPVFAALVAHDFDGFAANQLAQRRDAMLPPFSHQALLKCEAPVLEAGLDFLQRAARQVPSGFKQVSVYDPVPMPMARLAGRARAQLLIESVDRTALHRCIQTWLPALPASTPRLRWQLEVDPAEI